MTPRACGFAGGDTSRVIVLAIPDWGVTPFAIQSGRERGGGEPMLVEDGLHPSAALYALWAEAAMAPARAAWLWA